MEGKERRNVKREEEVGGGEEKEALALTVPGTQEALNNWLLTKLSDLSD